VLLHDPVHQRQPAERCAQDARRDETREVVRRWLPEALEDLESLIALGKLEMGR